MGQPVAVTEKPSSLPGMIRFEINRSLTGMGHESYLSNLDAIGATPGAELARRLFATGQVAGVHVYSNMITVDLAKGHPSDGLADVVRDLYQYWKPGMVPPALDELAPAPESDGGSTTIGDGAAPGDAALSEAAKRVPPHLLERSRLARERWKAKQGG